MIRKETEDINRMWMRKGEGYFNNLIIEARLVNQKRRKNEPDVPYNFYHDLHRSKLKVMHILFKWVLSFS